MTEIVSCLKQRGWNAVLPTIFYVIYYKYKKKENHTKRNTIILQYTSQQKEIYWEISPITENPTYISSCVQFLIAILR